MLEYLTVNRTVIRSYDWESKKYPKLKLAEFLLAGQDGWRKTTGVLNYVSLKLFSSSYFSSKIGQDGPGLSTR